MITTKLATMSFRRCRLQSGLATIFIALILPCTVQSRVPRVPGINLIHGITAGGHPYLSGGISFDEQRAIERVGHLYNLKIIFARPVGTLTTPVFLMIGFNDARHVEKIPLRAPWFYIQLPSGGYTILARFKREVVLVRDVYLGEGRDRTYFLRGE